MGKRAGEGSVHEKIGSLESNLTGCSDHKCLAGVMVNSHTPGL